MPFSHSEGRPWMLERLRNLQPESMLDIGAGSGTYGKMFAEHFPHAYRVGIEIWRPYLIRFDLPTLYDDMHCVDVREYFMFPSTDVIIMGDVLEHMTEADALRVWDMARDAARKAVYLSIPIIHYPQGEYEGNPHEAHVVDDWNHERVLATFDGIGECYQGSVVGAYEALA